MLRRISWRNIWKKRAITRPKAGLIYLLLNDEFVEVSLLFVGILVLGLNVISVSTKLKKHYSIGAGCKNPKEI